MTGLIGASVAIIRAGQDPSGAYIASPTFPQYGYAWLRDGSFCAMAMQAAGDPGSAARFHQWVCRAIAAQTARAEAVTADLVAGRSVPPGRMLPTRYRLDGTEESGAEQWPNFQLDGYGTWLAALWSFYGTGLPAGYERVVRVVAAYLAAAWRLPCYDYWEESADHVHTSTLAAIAAGLRAAARLTGEAVWDRTADEIVAYIGAACVVDGAYVKGTADHRADGALLSLAVPFGLVSLDDPQFVATVARVRSELGSPSGGVRRYAGDTYYGGSPWILLTAWLGWYDRLTGDTDAYERAAAWVEAHAGPDGSLPEQVVAEPQAPDMVTPWERRWGPVADPLLWSHAMYVLMRLGGIPRTVIPAKAGIP